MFHGQSARQPVARFVMPCARGLNYSQSGFDFRVVAILGRSQLLQLRQRLRQLLPGLRIDLAQLVLSTHAILDDATWQKDRRIF
jgi:hypothetical protein